MDPFDSAAAWYDLLAGGLARIERESGLLPTRWAPADGCSIWPAEQDSMPAFSRNSARQSWPRISVKTWCGPQNPCDIIRAFNG